MPISVKVRLGQNQKGLTCVCFSCTIVQFNAKMFNLISPISYFNSAIFGLNGLVVHLPVPLSVLKILNFKLMDPFSVLKSPCLNSDIVCLIGSVSCFNCMHHCLLKEPVLTICCHGPNVRFSGPIFHFNSPIVLYNNHSVNFKSHIVCFVDFIVCFNGNIVCLIVMLFVFMFPLSVVFVLLWLRGSRMGKK